MNEQYAGRAANSPAAMTTAADVVGQEHVPAAAPVPLPIAGFNFEGAGKHDKKLAPGGRVPILIQAFGHLRHHRALRRQYRGAARGVAPGIGRRIVDRESTSTNCEPPSGAVAKRMIFIRVLRMARRATPVSLSANGILLEESVAVEWRGL
jgi:hypothetical protein